MSACGARRSGGHDGPRTMTPFGERVRTLRAERGVTLVEMAEALGVSPAYLSALEHGKRGRPSFTLIQGVIHKLGIIWDEADRLVRLADLSHPRVVVDTAGLAPEATLLANRLAREVALLSADDLRGIAAILDEAAARRAFAEGSLDRMPR